MPVSVPEFWKLLVESRLATVEKLRPIKEKFAAVKGAETQGNSLTLSEWLVANGVVSRYQAKVLMAGRPGPFCFGDYVVYDRHGGPFKGVFKAIHPPTRQQVVLAFFTGAATQNPHWWSIIVQQMAVFSRAVHPNLCRVFQVCDTGSYKFAVLEYVRGQSAVERLQAGAMAWPEACRIVQQTALALGSLLEVGQLHYAVQPANIWIDRQDNAKLLLPPLARDPLALPAPINFAAADPAWLAGVADYLAPELAQPGQSPNASTDVYALGCTLYQLIAGRPPYAGEDVQAKLRSHAAEALPSLDALGVPPLVSHALASMTAKNPALRFQHPQLVADALGGILQQFEPAQLSHPASPIPATQANFDAWLGQQSVVPSLPQLAAPPVAGDFAAMPVVATNVPVIQTAAPVIHTAAPVSQTAAEIPSSPAQVDPIAAMAAAAAAPPADAMFEFSQLDPLVAKPSEPETPFVLPIDAVQPSKVADRVAGRTPRKRSLLVKLLGGLVACAVVGGGAYFAATQLQKPPAVTPPSPPETSEGDDTLEDEAGVDGEMTTMAHRAGGVAAAGPGDSPLVADNGVTLWESPTSGSPWALDYVAPATQSLLLLRPAELIQHPEGEKLLAAFGPRGEAARKELEAVAGPLADMERLTVAWVDPLTPESTGAGGWPLTPVYVVQFAKPVEVDAFVAKWNNPQPAKESSEQTYTTPIGVAFFPAKAQRKTLVIGPAAQIKDIIQQGGKSPPIRLELAKLLPTTDDRRLATLLLVPSATLIPESAIFTDNWQNLVGPAREFLGDAGRGANFSLHLDGESLFLELRLLNSTDAEPDVTAEQLRQRTAKLPETIERFVAGMNPQPYGRFVLVRFPQMIKLLEEFTRVGTDNQQIVLRTYLPAAAAHNLALGTELALAESGGSTAGPLVASSGTSPAGTAASTSVADRLQRKTSLNFDRDTLEKAMILLADDVGVKIEILGGDLQLEGITKNQSFGLDERDKPAAEILRNIMLKANPDGKLVYVIKPKERGGEEMLFVTTRAAAAKRGDKLPAELEKK